MDELTQYYRQGLLARIDALDALRRRLQEPDLAAVASIRALAHMLRGSGASYGFPEISEAATVVEQAAETALPECTEQLLEVLRGVAAQQAQPSARVLLIDADVDAAERLAQHLSAAGREVVRAHSAAEVDAQLGTVLSLIVCDPALPDRDARHFLAGLLDEAGAADIPVIVTASGTEGFGELESFALGADAYLRKPVEPEAVAALVAARLRRGSRSTGRDPFTGLPSEGAFREVFERAALLTAREREPLTLALLRVDGLEEPDELHELRVAGEARRHMLGLLKLCFRKSDVLAPAGRDGFWALFPNTDRAGAVRALEKAYHLLQREPFVSSGGEQRVLTLTPGVAEVEPGATLDDCRSAAERDLEETLRSGRTAFAEAPPPASLPRRATVLIVEDDLLTAQIVRHRLERAGLDVEHASDGAAALDLIARTTVSLVVLDVKLPHVDGFEVLRRVRSMRAMRGVPVVLLTSMGSEEDVVRGLEMGADDYVVKPFSPVELVARVRRLLRAA